MSWLARAEAPHRCVMPRDDRTARDGDIWRCDACGICWRARVFDGDQREPGRSVTFTRLPDETLVRGGHAVLPGSTCHCDGPPHQWSPGWCPSSGPVHGGRRG